MNQRSYVSKFQFPQCELSNDLNLAFQQVCNWSSEDANNFLSDFVKISESPLLGDIGRSRTEAIFRFESKTFIYSRSRGRSLAVARMLMDFQETDPELLVALIFLCEIITGIPVEEEDFNPSNGELLWVLLGSIAVEALNRLDQFYGSRATHLGFAPSRCGLS